MTYYIAGAGSADRADTRDSEGIPVSVTVFTDHPPLHRLPLVTLYLTDRCNSRCVTCDYWRHGRDDMTLESVARLLPSLRQLRTQVVLISGGEPLLNPEWAPIAEALRSNGQQIWLLTSGLSLTKHAHRAAELFHSVTVSLDGADARTYTVIRGLDAFDKVCEGIRVMANCGAPANIRVTLQRANYRQLPALVDLANDLGARSISFLTVDVANPHAFGRTDDFAADLALRPEDLTAFEHILSALERDRRDDFRSGFIVESPQKLRRHLQYFAAICGHGDYPPVRCNAPEFSAVIGTTGRVQPCFFIPGPADARVSSVADGLANDLTSVLNRGDLTTLRSAIRAGARRECKTCVCSLWRDPDKIASSMRLPQPLTESTV